MSLKKTPEEKKETRRINRKAYYLANRDKVKKRSIDYYNANREEIRAYMKKYYQANKETFRLRQIKYAAKKKAAL